MRKSITLILSVLLAACAEREQEVSTTFLVSVPTPEAMMYGNLSNEEMQMQQHGSFGSEGAATSRMTAMTNSPYNYAWTPKMNPTVVTVPDPKTEAALAAAQSQNTNLQSQNKNLQSQNTSLQSQNTNLQSQNTSLQQQLNASPFRGCKYNNLQLASGQTKTYYKSGVVPFGQTCRKFTLTCKDRQFVHATKGLYMNDLDGLHETCTVQSAKSCTNPTDVVGGLPPATAHGETLTLYKKNSVIDRCDGDNDYSMKCHNGRWQYRRYSSSYYADEGWDHWRADDYRESTCRVRQALSCYLDGKTVQHGDYGTFYKRSGSYGDYYCSRASRRCWDGVLNISGEYNRATCEDALRYGRMNAESRKEPIAFSSLPYQWEDLQAMTQPDQITAQSFPDTTKCSDWGFWKGKGYKISEYPLSGYRGCKASCFATSNRIWDADKGQMVNLGWYNSNPDGKYVLHKDYLRHYNSINAVKNKVDSCMRCEKAKFAKQCTYKKRRYTVVTGTQKIDVLNH